MGCGGSKPEEPEETFPVPEPEKKPLTISEETAAINAKIKEAAAKKASEGGEEKTERESRLIRETRMSKGRNSQPGCETDNKMSSSGG